CLKRVSQSYNTRASSLVSSILTLFDCIACPSAKLAVASYNLPRTSTFVNCTRVRRQPDTKAPCLSRMTCNPVRGFTKCVTGSPDTYPESFVSSHPRCVRVSPAQTWRCCPGLLITALAVQVCPYAAAASLGRDDPGTIEPGRLMAHMLLVSTFQICYPILGFVLMKTDDL